MHEILQNTALISEPKAFSWGTGYHLSDGLILTVAHVIPPNSTLRVSLENQTYDVVCSRSCVQNPLYRSDDPESPDMGVVLLTKSERPMKNSSNIRLVESSFRYTKIWKVAL